MATDPLERSIRNQLDLAAFTNGLDRETARRVRDIFDEVAAELVRTDPTEASTAQARRALVLRFMERARSVIGDGYEVWQKDLRTRLAELGAEQAKWARTTLVQSLGGPGAMGGLGVSLSDPTAIGVNFFKSVLDTQPFEGQTLAEWASTQTDAAIVKTRKEIQLGLAQNETVGDLVRRIRGTVLDTNTRQTQAIVRTAVTDIANAAHVEAYKRESDITEKYEYNATLDDRTTLICASLDGQTFAYDDPDAPRPPQHYNCRSIITPRIKWEDLGLEPPPEPRRVAEAGTAAPARTVAPGTTYEQWLRDKSASDQDRILGPGRGELFREGTSLRDMVRDNREVLTIDELRERT